MDKNGVIGHNKPLAALARAFDQGRTSHAYLITGPAHVGKMTVATVLAQCLNCLADNGGGACGECEQCRRIARGVHVDLTVVPVDVDGSLHEDKKPRTTVTIEQVRRVSREAALRPFEGRYKVFVFEDADRLGEEASNALLKTLEEPPELVVIVLLASGDEAVLPTIASRCHGISLRPVPWPVLSRALIDRLGLTEERALEMARTSGGRPGLALRMAEDEEFAAVRTSTLDEIETAVASGLEGRFKYAASFASLFARDRGRAREALALWRGWWRDVLIAGQGLDDYVSNISRAESVRETAAAVGPAGAVRGLRAAVEAATRLDMNVAPALALEQMMLSLPAR